CEMAAYYRTKGISMIQARENLYKEYGVYVNKVENFTCEGASGMERMKEIMANLRSNTPKEVAGMAVTAVADYMASTIVAADGTTSEIKLPKSDVVTLTLTDGASIVVRPSGTEPKVKAYYTTVGKTREEAEALQKKLSAEFTKVLGF
ncbi:MAG: phospho-sugar mutase, partial [Oscillospiraceae bacterium]